MLKRQMVTNWFSSGESSDWDIKDKSYIFSFSVWGPL